MAYFFDKFPAEIIDFEIDCTPVLLGGDTIAAGAGSAVVSSSDLTINGAQTSINAARTMVTFWCTGGEPGRVAKVTVSITTAAGRYRQSLVLIVIKPL